MGLFFGGFFLLDFFPSEHMEFLPCYGNVLKIVFHLVWNKITFCSNLTYYLLCGYLTGFYLQKNVLKSKTLLETCSEVLFRSTKELFDGTFHTTVLICWQIRYLKGTYPATS